MEGGRPVHPEAMEKPQQEGRTASLAGFVQHTASYTVGHVTQCKGRGKVSDHSEAKFHLKSDT